MGRCLICRPRVVTEEGADHIGVDARMRCAKCGRTTINHIECGKVTEKVRGMLRAEFSAGRCTNPEPRS